MAMAGGVGLTELFRSGTRSADFGRQSYARSPSVRMSAAASRIRTSWECHVGCHVPEALHFRHVLCAAASRRASPLLWTEKPVLPPAQRTQAHTASTKNPTGRNWVRLPFDTKQPENRSPHSCTAHKLRSVHHLLPRRIARRPPGAARSITVCVSFPAKVLFCRPSINRSSSAISSGLLSLPPLWISSSLCINRAKFSMTSSKAGWAGGISRHAR